MEVGQSALIKNDTILFGGTPVTNQVKIERYQVSSHSGLGYHPPALKTILSSVTR